MRIFNLYQFKSLTVCTVLIYLFQIDRIVKHWNPLSMVYYMYDKMEGKKDISYPCFGLFVGIVYIGFITLYCKQFEHYAY